MVVQVHGFDWAIYAERVMPAFAQWLLSNDESAIYPFFTNTRCARDEAFLPAAMQRARLWPRARSFVEMLPRGPYSQREYQKLCSAESFTAISDRYMYRHPPQLYQSSEAIRGVWGALVETYCLPWSTEEDEADPVPPVEQLPSPRQEQKDRGRPIIESERVERDEVISLLQAAGMGELAQEMDELELAQTEHLVWKPDLAGYGTQEEQDEYARFLQDEEEEDEEVIGDEEIEGQSQPMPGGILVGGQPNILHLRGWLAGISVHAMALFEYLACGRRCMPFGYEPSEPYGVFIGYLTPDEVWRLGITLRGVADPQHSEAEEDYLKFRAQHSGHLETARLPDEVLPTHAAEFHRAIDAAAAQGLGLICSVE